MKKIIVTNLISLFFLSFANANDPKSMFTTKTINKGGFLKKGDKTTIVQEYTMNGAVHHDGPVSTRTAWIDPSGLTGEGEKKPSAKTIECIKARGSGEGTGRMVGGSVGAAAGSQAGCGKKKRKRRRRRKSRSYYGLFNKQYYCDI